MRDNFSKNLRPYESNRFKDSTPFQLLSEKDGKRFEVDRYGWLARQWSSTKQRNPTKREIMNGILAQDQAIAQELMHQGNMKPEEMQSVVQARVQAWEVFFHVTALGQGDLGEELDFKSLWKQPSHPINQTILYIYSLETFIPQRLNTASRDRDQSLVESMGAFALALKTIVYGANKHRKDAITKDFVVWRGFNLSSEQLEEYRKLAAEDKAQLHLMGFTSTLLNRKQAESYALQDYDAKKAIPVIANITMNTRYKYF